MRYFDYEWDIEPGYIKFDPEINIDPVRVSEPDIITPWFNVETNDAVLDSDAVDAKEADCAFITYEAVWANVTKDAV